MRFPLNRGRGRQRGQSMTEFAVVMPIMLILIAFGLDFGRAFLGWVTLNNVAREAANFASANADAWNSVNPNAAAQAEYDRLIAADAAGIDCVLPSPLPAPSFPNGPDGPNALGAPVRATITCQFGFITPVGWIMSFVNVPNSVGDRIPMTATAAFPIRQGVIEGIPVEATVPTPSPSPTPTPDPSASPTPSPTTTPEPQCAVPNLLNVKAVNAQQAWNAAGFTILPVVFDPLLPARPPNGGGNIRSQSIPAGQIRPCLTTGITVTWT